MTNEELQSRIAKTKGLIVERTNMGYMVTSSTGKGGYLVTDNNNRLDCSCTDCFMHNKKDPSWKCKHILAVEAALEKPETTGSRFSALEI